MRVRRRKYGEKKSQHFFGEYLKKYYGSGFFVIPPKWIRKGKRNIYCVKCRDVLQEMEYLVFFYSYEELIQHAEELREYGEIRIVNCSRRRILPLLHIVKLPEDFCDAQADEFERRVRCLGCIKWFEIWKEDDVTQSFKDLENEKIFSEFPFCGIEI